MPIKLQNGERNGKPVEQLDLSYKLIQRYPSVYQAAKATGTNAAHLRRAIKNGRPAKGWLWRRPA